MTLESIICYATFVIFILLIYYVNKKVNRFLGEMYLVVDHNLQPLDQIIKLEKSIDKIDSSIEESKNEIMLEMEKSKRYLEFIQSLDEHRIEKICGRFYLFLKYDVDKVLCKEIIEESENKARYKFEDIVVNSLEPYTHINNEDGFLVELQYTRLVFSHNNEPLALKPINSKTVIYFINPNKGSSTIISETFYL